MHKNGKLLKWLHYPIYSKLRCLCITSFGSQWKNRVVFVVCSTLRISLVQSLDVSRLLARVSPRVSEPATAQREEQFILLRKVRVSDRRGQ